MTLTVTRPAAPAPIATPVAQVIAPPYATAADLLALLDDAIGVCADLEPDELHSDTPAGDALVALSAIGRRAVEAAGVDPGTSLRSGPGVVVVRDLVAVTRLLRRSVGSGGPDVGHLVGAAALSAAARSHARFLDSAPGQV